MPTLKLAPLPEENAAAVFRTYSNYMSAWTFVLRNIYGQNGLTLRANLQAKAQYSNFKLVGADLTEVRRHLRAAWNNEASMFTFLESADGDAVRYANVWAPVQSYYATFAALRALQAASKNGAFGHVSHLKTVASLLKSQKWVGGPWTAACVGCPSVGTESWREVPSSSEFTISNLAVPHDDDSAWGLLARSLKSARTKMLEEAFEKWRRDNGKTNMPKAAKIAVAHTKHDTTLFDFLYRMRIRSNYRDTDAFVLGAWLESDARAFYQSALELLSFVLRFVEVLVCGRIGEPKFQAIVYEFAKVPRAGNFPVSRYWK